MSHEKSITVERDGRHFVLDNSGFGKGNVLGAKRGYKTQREANAYAKKRSKSFNSMPITQKPKVKRALKKKTKKKSK